MSVLLEAHDLVIEYQTSRGRVRALDGADLTVLPGEVLGLVGESGCGKTTLGLAVGRLLPANAERSSGELEFGGRSIFALEPAELESVRRRELGFVFQDPIGSLDPTARIGKQLAWLLGSDGDIDGLLTGVGLADVEQVRRSYPHELSGGMAQRVGIALAIARGPRLVVADEPTAALDASVRVRILELLVELCRERKATVVLLSHDLSIVSKFCDRVAVMYGGRVVEVGATVDVFRRPAHPYTEAMLHAAPGAEHSGGRIEPIPGLPPVLTARSEQCAFAPRCPWAIDQCATVRPERRTVLERGVVCHRAEEVIAAERAAVVEGGAE